MFSRISRRPVFLCLALSLALAVALGTFGIGVAQEKEKTDGPNEKIDQLLREYLKVVTRLYDMQFTRYQQGIAVDIEDVLEVQTMMRDARLPFCETKEERIRVYEGGVAATKKALALAEMRVKLGMGDQTDVVMTQVHLLEMQIELEKEKARE